MKPYHNGVIVKLSEEKSENKTLAEGTIFAIGDSDSIKVKIGDRILFLLEAAWEVEIENQKLILLDDIDILVIL